jgi:uncharacterized membrane protein YgaE (UPF0421/DUF939 family)
MKKYFNKFIKLFTDRKIWVRQILVSTLSAAVAWEIGGLAYKGGGLVAAIVSTLTVRISLYRSVREGLAQVVGTAFGALVAFISLSLFHLGLITVAMTVLFSFVFARALRMSESAAVNVPITALIVIGPGLSESTAYHRILSTAIGAAIAIPFSYFSHPSTPEGRTVEKINRAARKCATLLGELSEVVISGLAVEIAGELLAQARELIEEIPSLRSQAEEARRYAKWIPLAQEDVALELQRKSIAIEHIVVQVRTIARTVYDLAVNGGLPENVIRPIGLALSTASEAINNKISENVLGQSYAKSSIDDLRRATAELSISLVEVRDLANQTQVIRAISLVSNLERIADSLAQSTPAITEVETPDIPGSEGIINLNPVTSSKKISRKAFRKIIKRNK